jgi:hypothetical protein
VFMDFGMREHCTFDNKVFARGKCYYSNSIFVTNFVLNLVPDCRSENNFPGYFHVEFAQQNFRIVPRELIGKHPSSS